MKDSRILLLLSLLLLQVVGFAQKKPAKPMPRPAVQALNKETFKAQYQALHLDSSTQNITNGIFICASSLSEFERLKQTFIECPALKQENAHIFIILLPDSQQTQAFTYSVEEILRSTRLSESRLMVIDNKALATDLLFNLKFDQFPEVVNVISSPSWTDFCQFIDEKLQELKAKKEPEEDK